MASEISRLLDLLLDPAAAPVDLSRGPHFDLLRPSLRSLLALLSASLRRGPGGLLGIQAWTRPQIAAVAGAARLVVAAASRTPVDRLEPLVVAIVEESLELCTSFLQLSEFDSDDFVLENEIAQLLETLLFDGGDLSSGNLSNFFGQSILASLLDVHNLGSIEMVSDHHMCTFQDSSCWKEKKQTDKVLMTLAVGSMSQAVALRSIESRFYNPRSTSSYAQHWAIVHVKCVDRILLSSKGLFNLSRYSAKQLSSGNFKLRSSFALVILKLLVKLTSGAPYAAMDYELLNALVLYADNLLALFRHGFEFGYSDAIMGEDSAESQLLLLLEEFLRLVRTVFGDGCVFQNIQTYIAAVMMDSLDATFWNYDRTMLSLYPPVTYFPKVAVYLLRLIRSIRDQRLHSLDLSGCFSLEAHEYAWDIGPRKVFLLKNYSHDECLNLVFHPSKPWTENLVQVAFFLHSEASKSHYKVERSRSFQAKTAVTSGSDSLFNQEDDALFGDLFSEAAKPSGLADGRQEQPSSGTFPVSYYLMQSSMEVVTFLKECVFSPKWCQNIYSEACKKINETQIRILLSILSSQILYDERTCVSSEGSFPDLNVGKICLELLQDLFSNHVLSHDLEQHLVSQILKVENGKYIYNDYTLSLLAHVFISRLDVTNDQLAANAYMGFVKFIVDKANNIGSCCLELNEFLQSLPTMFHLEILLMAFYLSSDDERSSIANIVLSSLKTLVPPPCEYNIKQVSLWGLSVSKLLLVMQHMLLYPTACPSWLMVQLKLRLGEVPDRANSVCSLSDRHLVSWTSMIVKDLMSDCIKDATLVNNLLPHLMDFSSLSLYDMQNTIFFQNLKLNSNELLSSLLHILSLWDGRKPESVQDLMLERYIFMLCWNTGFIVYSSCSGPPSDWKKLSFDWKSLFYLGQLLLRDANAECKDADFYSFSLNLLEELQSIQKSGSTECGFLRNESWLSLVISLIYYGVWKYAIRHGVDGVKPVWGECIRGSNSFSTFAENMVEALFRENHVDRLICVLSSLLKMYMNVFQQAFLNVFDRKKCFLHGFSPVVLAKHKSFDGYIKLELLEKCGSDFGQLGFCFDLLSKMDGISREHNTGCSDLFIFLHRHMLHGIPCYDDVCSATFLSCVLIIHDIVCAFDGLLKVRSQKIPDSLDIAVIHDLACSLMSIKSDKTFQCIHDKCADILANLHPIFGTANYGCLFQLKDMENFLMTMNLQDQSDYSMHETVVTTAIDLLEKVKRESSVLFGLYLNAASMPAEVTEFFSSQHGDLLILINALDKCRSEAVIVKVVNFFLELFDGPFSCPGIKAKVLQRFIDMDVVCLSRWVDSRLLGSIARSSEGLAITYGSSSVREAMMNFMTSLLGQQPSEPLSRELHSKLVQAMLMSLDNAFIAYDIFTAKVFFNYLLQLINGKTFIKQLLEKVVPLIQKLGEDEGSLQVLKFLLGFLGVVLGDSGSYKNTMSKLPGRFPSGNNFGAGSQATEQVARKRSETVVLADTTGTSSAHLDCEAISADEDEDDGTSDGELASMEKDEEEDSNSEKALASKVCTYTSSGSNFMEQHWYFCYTCDLTVSKGCCSVCAKVCHRGHRVVYSRSSRFFCDCGAGGVRGSNCQCLKPRKFSGCNSTPVRGGHTLQSFITLSEVGEQPVDSDSDLDDDVCTDMDNLKLSIPREVQDVIASIFEDLGLENRVLELCDKLFPSVSSRRNLNISKEKKVILGDNKVLSYAESFQLKKSYKSGSFDLKIRADYPNSRELKSHLSSGNLMKSLLSISGRGRLAAGEGDRVSIFDVGQLIGPQTSASATTEKPKPLSKNTVRFEVVHLMFNPVIENYLLVAGYEECQVLTVNSRGEVTDRLAVELALQGAYIRRVNWVPGSQVQLLVVTNMFVKIYDLSQDNISPIHYFTLEGDSIMDGVLIAAALGKFILLVLSETGSLFRLELSMECYDGAKPLKEIVDVPKREAKSKGTSMHYSISYRLLFLSYQDGTTLVGCLDADASSIVDISPLHEIEHEGKLKPAALHHWNELLTDSGVFACLSSLKQNTVLSVSLTPHELFAQNMRHTGTSSSSVVGIAAYKPLSKDKSHCLVLHDDGSLQIYTHTSIGGEAIPNAVCDQVKKIGAGILNNKAYASTNPEFPLDFFEKTLCITADVKFSSEAMKNCDSEGTKQRLASDDGFLESPSPAGFKISISNLNPDIVMVGFRVHVGNTSLTHIPSDIAIFHRKIKLDEAMRYWYDVPFTVAESLLADEEFVISVGPTFDGSSSPRIDSIEVYGRSKDEFGWKEKMDAILAMEADLLGAPSGAPGAGKKCRAIKASSLQEQVTADALKLLSKLYSLSRFQMCTGLEEASVLFDKIKCKSILEKIFESDREPLLQSAACHVLQAIFPKRDIYYHVKDTLCLLGVVKSSHSLASWIGVGGAANKFLIKELTAKMRMVSKITMLRRSNMIAFLETHGSGVVDRLMQVLWGILDLGQPDTQTINNVIIPAVELIYSYSECLAFQETDVTGCSVAPAVRLLKKLIFAPYDSVQMSSSLAISSRLLQVPFPKQTMLATDDAMENSSALHSRLDATNSIGGNVQAVLDEESGASSVQYCCDGCSTVPILRRRWHCNICPDFDLCEACYEVMDADRLPPPHSKDHPMSAIPIEIDSLGGDVNEIQFSLEDLGDGSLMQIPANVRMQNSSPTHVLESNEGSEFPPSSIDQRIVSISASKRAVNSLLLRQLLAELKGWMETTSGIRAIPVMQLFYRLSSAVGGPFMDSSKPENLDLEKFVIWFLDEINLDKPFAAKTRSSFGEITILIFMFFTLMLRNWHHPGNDSSQSKVSGVADVQDKSGSNISSTPAALCSKVDQEKDEFASQLVRACSYLRQQTFVNYLMDILQQLVPHFKSASTTDGNPSLPTNSGCGSLLTVRKELPAGNFSPFFSDSYAKSHRLDLFMDYHKLLLENTFRLVYSLVRPEKHDRSADNKTYRAAASKDLKLDGYQDVLCNYISNSNTSFVRRYARRLFLHLCGSKTHYYNVRDSWQFSHEVKRLYKFISKSGGVHNYAPYERGVKLVKCLSTIAEVAAVRPRNWQKYCSKHGDILSFLMDGAFFFTEESVIHALKLLNLALYPGKDMLSAGAKTDNGDTGSGSSKLATHSTDVKKKRKAEDGAETNAEKSCLDMEHAVEILFLKEANVLKNFIDTFLLDWNSSNVRMEAKCVLHGAWYHGKRAFKETLLTSLLQKIKFLPMFGQNIVEYCELLTMLFGKVPDSTKHHETELVTQCLTSDVISCIYETLHSQNELLANHPNSRIYNTLSALVEFDGYYLESEPCVACSCPEVPYSRMKLETLKFETKYTDNRIIVKCTGSYTIQSVTMNVHDARKSKSVKVLNLYYNNRAVSDLSELKNNWSMWKRAKSCQLAFNQTELKVEFPIPITACNFMIEFDSFYENLQASSLESLQCPRCSRPVTDKHGICSNCHENAYQCRQCRNINYENLDSFLCNECGYSKYGRFEFNFMARPSFLFESLENDEDMKKVLAAIDSESENAHRRYQQLIGFKKPLLKLVSSIGEHEMDSQQKDTVQQMMVSLPGPSCKINRKIALLGVLYGEKCKAAFDSVSKSVQTLQGLRRVLMTYLQQKNLGKMSASTRFAVPRSPNNCYGCATTFVAQCMDMLQVLSKLPNCRKQLVASGILSELFENNIHQGPKAARTQARSVLCAFSEGDASALAELNNLIQRKVMYCLEHHRSMDIAQATREELLLLSETCAVVDDLWEARLRIGFQLLFASIRRGAKHPVISEHIILPCLRIVSQACTPPKSDASDQSSGKSSSVALRNDDTTNSASISVVGNMKKSVSEMSDKHLDACRRGQDIPLISYSEWEKGVSYLDFVRRQYKISQVVKANSQRSRQGSHRADYLALKYGLRWRCLCCKRTIKSDFSTFALGSWVSELILSSCSQSIRAEVCNLISLLCPQNTPRRFQLLNLLMTLLPATLSVGESAAEYFELFFKVIDSETARLFLTAKGCLATICKLISQEVGSIESQERSLNIDISQGFIIHKLVELLTKFLELPNIRCRFMRDDLLTEILESLIVIRGLVVQKTKLISDCNKLLKDLLDSLLLESDENKRQFIRACISGLQVHGKERKGRTRLFILEQLCNIICPSKPEPVYHLILNKAHTQEEFIRGSMTKNPYSSIEVGPLMRDVKNKICHQLDLLGLLEDDYGMELLVAGNIISLDLSICQVYEQVWKKSQSQVQNSLANNTLLSSGGLTPGRDCPPMTVTYRLQGLDGEATEPMIKELEEEREELLDPEVEFAIAGAVREFGGMEIILSMIQSLQDDDLKSNREELCSVLNMLMYCCKIRENRQALLRLGALGLLLETARRAFSVDAMEPAEGILLIVEILTIEANESDVGTAQSVLTVSNGESGTGDQAKKIVLMFLERLSHPSGLKMSSKQQRNNEMVARILPYLTYGEPAAMDALIDHFNPYLQDWAVFDHLQRQYQDNPKDENLGQQAIKQRFEVENFVRVSESLKTSSCGERLKDIILEKGITATAVQHLRKCFAVTSQAGFKTSPEWQNGLKLPSIPLILSMLRGLSRGHLSTQTNIDECGTLPLLHILEGVPGENEIGARAENLLDTLADKENNGDGFLGEKVLKLRHATRSEMRLRALRKREELLQGLGMRQELASDGGERIIVARTLIEGLEDVEEEEDGLACMVCREGYTLRPNDMLGVYTFSKRVNLGVGSSGSSRGECVYTTVSHFNIIHFQCHQEAKRADAALKNPKKEWEGATLRNNETLCNSIFPLKGPSVPFPQYIRCVDQYWDNLGALGRADGSRIRLLTYDIVLMLARFATGASFSTDSKGGGRESNSRFLPFMIQMACHLLDQGVSGQQQGAMAKSISTFLSSTAAVDSPTRLPSAPAPSGGRPTSGPSDETVQFMMVNSLLCESYEEWSQHLLTFLQRGIYHAYMQHTHGRSSLRLSSDPATSVVRSTEGLADNSKLFPIIQPMLVYTGLIEQLQRFLKYSKSVSARPSKETDGDDGSNSGGGAPNLERWEVLMRERLVNMKEMLGFSKELLSWLEDMTTSEDLQEAFDVMGVLGTVLSSGFSTCQEFVQSAITSGRG